MIPGAREFFSGSSEAPPHERYVPKPFYGSSHWWASTQLENLLPTTKVLDVGAGSGVVGEFLREKGLTELYAQEPSDVARTYITPIYKRVEASLGDFKDLTFDCVIMLDVLEHMAEPERYLEELEPQINPGGIILISVPNVVHWSARLQILCGSFYTARGILDSTHLRFFTPRTIVDLVKRIPSFRIQVVASSISPAELVVPKPWVETEAFRWFSQSRFQIAQAFPSFAAYQTLIRAEKRT